MWVFSVFLDCLGSVLIELMWVFSVLSVWNGKMGSLRISSDASKNFYHIIFFFMRARGLLVFVFWIVCDLFNDSPCSLNCITKDGIFGIVKWLSVEFCIKWKVLTLLIYGLFWFSFDGCLWVSLLSDLWRKDGNFRIYLLFFLRRGGEGRIKVVV